MADESLAVVVLAAGASVRMGSPKALLRDPEGDTFLHRILRCSESAGLTLAQVIVAEPAVSTIVALEPPSGLPLAPRFVTNQDSRLGMLSSIQAGLRELTPRPEVHGALVWGVDHPLVLPKTVSALARASAEEPTQLVLPVFRGRRGHPVVFPRSLWQELFETPLDQGAVAVVSQHRAETVEVSVDDEGVLANIDSREDYRRWFGGAEPRSH